MMKWIALLLLFLPSTVMAADINLNALSDFQPGRWRIVEAGHPDHPRGRCLPDRQTLLTGGRRAAECRFIIVRNDNNDAAVTYQCAGGLSGRTDLRREAEGLLTLTTQGLEGGLPFARREEWRRVGECKRPN